MIIDFESIEPKKVEGMKGGEGVVFTRRFEDEMGAVIMNEMEPGSSVGFHTHTGNSEVIYVVEGEGQIFENGEYKAIHAGQADYCAEGCSHSLINNSGNKLTVVAYLPNQERK